MLHALVQAPPQVCMKNEARGGVSRDKYSTRQKNECFNFYKKL